jgi:hypothetical protein
MYSSNGVDGFVDAGTTSACIARHTAAIRTATTTAASALTSPLGWRDCRAS